MDPFTRTAPVVGLSTPVMIFRIVDLPEPFVPMMPTVSPRRIVRLMSSSARCSV